MKKEEYSSIAKNLQNISDGTLSVERTGAAENASSLFTEQFQGTTSGKGYMKVYDVFPGIEASLIPFLPLKSNFITARQGLFWRFTIAAAAVWDGICAAEQPSIWAQVM